MKALAVILLVVGMGGFVGQGLTSSGTFGQMRTVEWPVGRTAGAVSLSGGRYAVPLEHVGRVQVYSPDLRFEYGWQVDAVGGAFILLPADGGNLEVYAYRGNRHLLYRPSGELLSERKDDPAIPLPQRPTATDLQIPTAWWKLPFRGPFYSWSLGIAGLALLLATRTEAERARDRRRNRCRGRARDARPRTLIGRAARSAGEWLAAAVWAAFGFVWFFTTSAGLVRCLMEGNLTGALVFIPFVLIGCVLLFVSVTIVRAAASDVVRWARRGGGQHSST